MSFADSLSQVMSFVGKNGLATKAGDSAVVRTVGGFASLDSVKLGTKLLDSAKTGSAEAVAQVQALATKALSGNKTAESAVGMLKLVNGALKAGGQGGILESLSSLFG